MANQQWTLLDLGTGYYKLVNRATAMCVDTNSSTTNGAVLQLRTSGINYTQQWLPVTNLTLNNPVIASSSGSDSSCGIADGSTTTRWESNYTDPQWISIDLGGVHTLTEIRLNWETACGKDYQLQVSNDGATWTTVVTVTGNTTAGLKIYQVSTSGRYVRMYGTARATVWGYSLWEFEVYRSANIQ